MMSIIVGHKAVKILGRGRFYHNWLLVILGVLIELWAAIMIILRFCTIIFA